MMKTLMLVLSLFLLFGCGSSDPSPKTPETKAPKLPQVETPAPVESPVLETPTPPEPKTPESPEPPSDPSAILAPFQGRAPQQFAESLPGVITRFQTEEPLVALTFDACGGAHGSGYDAALVEYLIREEIPATLFLNGRWIESNLDTFLFLSTHPLFEVANHGDQHRPLSVTGASAYGIQGTASLEEAYGEVMVNQERILRLTGEAPRFFRSGTAYYDDVAVDLVRALGLVPVNFDVLGDAGGTFNRRQIASSMDTATAGSILLFHMNLPGSAVLPGLEDGVRALRQRGFRFVRLEDVADLLD